MKTAHNQKIIMKNAESIGSETRKNVEIIRSMKGVMLKIYVESGVKIAGNLDGRD